MLAESLASPLRSSEEINRRLDAVDYLRRRPDLVNALRSRLRKIHDIERCIQRISIGRGTSRDILAIGTTLQAIEEIVSHVRCSTGSVTPPALLSLLLSEARSFPTLSSLILRSVAPSPPLLLSLPGHVAEGFCEELDVLRTSTASGRDAIAHLLSQLKEESGIGGLKISRYGCA